MKTLSFLSLFFSLFLCGSFTAARSYPLKTITFNNCTGAECTVELPKIKNADYFSYRYQYDYRRVYSMLRLGTYFERRDVGIGSHQGIDIATTTGTPVYASYAGEVIVAERRGDRGNVIVIKHVWNNQTLYTTYAHLSAITVKVGDTVSEGEKIGEVGATGNATGPHLHFQIEKNQDANHPFFPKGCKGTIDEIVNEGNCFSQVREATLDPILFLETTVPMTEQQDTPSPTKNLYMTAKEILLTGFVGGFMETEQLQTLILTKKESGGTFLAQPITFSGNEQLVSLTPDKIQTLDGERSVFLQTKSATGIALVKVQYGAEFLQYIPLLINSPEGIAEWKQDEKLMTALKMLEIEQENWYTN